MKAPMLIPFMALGCGVLTASFYHDIWMGFACIFMGCLILFGLTFLLEKPYLNFKLSRLHIIWIFLFFFGIGVVDLVLHSPCVPVKEELEKKVVGVGIIKDINEHTSGEKIVVDLIKLYDENGCFEEYDNFLLLIDSDVTTCKTGDVVIFPIREITKIEDSKNSFLTGYAKYMNNKGVYYTCKNKGYDLLIVSTSTNLKRISETIRNKIVGFIEKVPLQRMTKCFVIPLLTGDRAYLDNNTRMLFADAGISHTLALSGLHVGIIAGFFLVIFFPLNFIGKYKLRLLLTAILLWAYAFITGMSPSVTRACLMATVLICAMLLERKNSAINSLAISGFIILLFDPIALYDIGFQLSFICVSSLVLFGKVFNPINHRIHPQLYRMFGIVVATFVATFASWIVVGYYFKTFPSMFLPANLIILPLLPLYVTLVILYLVLCLLGVECNLFSKIIDEIYSRMVEIIHLLGSDFSLNIHVPIVAVVLWFIGVAALYFLIKRKSNLTSILLSSPFFIISILLIVFSPSPIQKGLIVSDSAREINISVVNKRQNKTIIIPRKSISILSIDKTNVLVIDLPYFSKNIITDKTPLNKHENIDYVIIASGSSDRLSKIQEDFNPKSIIIHPSIGVNRENRLIDENNSEYIQIYSLRKEKALKILL